MKRLFGALLVLVLTAGLACAAESLADGLQVIYDEGLWGIADADGRVLIEPEFVNNFEMEGGVAVTAVEDTSREDMCHGFEWVYGAIDANGRVVLPLEYDDVWNYGEDTPLLADTGHGWRLFNRDGSPLNDQLYEDVSGFREGRTWAKADGKWGLLDGNGTWVVEPRFDGVHGFCEGIAAVQSGGRWGCIDTLGKWIVEPRFDEMNDFHEGAVSVRSGDQWGFIDAQGAWIAEPRFDEANYFCEGAAAVSVNDKWGFIDMQGAWIAEPKFNDVRDFSEGLAAVRQKWDWGYIDKRGAWIVEPQYFEAYSFRNGCGEVRLDGKSGMVDRTGRVVLPLEYDRIDGFWDSEAGGDGTITAWKDGKDVSLCVTENGIEPVAVVDSELSLKEYTPFMGEKVARLAGASNFAWASEAQPLPRLDGATALYPVYAAFAEAVYPDEINCDYEDEKALVACTKTNRAYERLVSGEADVIFCAGPSQRQVEAARAAGVEFELTPFGREAFVFIVNRDNPLESLTTEEIRAVYSGRVTQWDELNVDGLGEIIAYQRPKDSGSQTALERMMGDTPIMTPPRGRTVDQMDGIIESVAASAYRNLPAALGYSFRFFCTEMMDREVKLLALDGVAPSLENIRSGAYPEVTTLYAVTRAGEENPNVRALLEWIVSAEGQELVEKSGYVGVAAR